MINHKVNGVSRGVIKELHTKVESL